MDGNSIEITPEELKKELKDEITDLNREIVLLEQQMNPDQEAIEELRKEIAVVQADLTELELPKTE